MALRHGPMAIVDISSNEIRMYIAEKIDGSINFLETLKYPLNLAKDTFGSGKISFDKVNKLCEILTGFIQVAGEYGVANIKTVATTAVREASNRDYILNQVSIKTGLNVKILDESAEKLYIFKILDHILKDELQDKSTLMAHIGAGSVGLAYSKNENTMLMQSIKVGALRISELFENIHNSSLEFYLMIEEYLRTHTDELKRHLPEEIDNIIISGNEATLIASLCSASHKGMLYSMNRQDFLNFYEEIKFKSIGVISSQYNIAQAQSETLLPAMCLYSILLEYTTAPVIITPSISLGQALIFEYFESAEFSAINKRFNKNILESAKKIAVKYNAVENHYTMVMSYCNKIFDRMKKIHGMSRRDKLLLQLAAILHDCGKFVNAENHHIHAYALIKGSEISGLTTEEIDIVASIALYHSRIVPDMSDDNYRDFKASKKVLVSKLSAILRVADALDRSHKQKIESIDVKLNGDRLIIKANAGDDNIDLEKWAFREKGLFFEEVFGIKPVLKAVVFANSQQSV